MTPAEITVFIPTFNRLESLKRAVRSVLSQDTSIHLHVLDNASDDGTQDWLREVQRNDSRVQLTLRTSNLGPRENFFDGFVSATTQYVVPLADDDELVSGFLADALMIMKNEADLGAVVCLTEIRTNGHASGLSPWKVHPGRHDPSHHLLLWSEFGHYVSWSSILWDTKTIVKHVASGELDRFGPPSDAWIQYLVFSEKPVFLHTRVGSIFTEHASQCSQMVGPGVITQIGEMIDCIDKHITTSGLMDLEERRRFIRNYCRTQSTYIMTLCQRMTPLPAKELLDDWWKSYLTYFHPHVGLEAFPLLPLFAQYREMQFANNELRGKAATYNRIRRSLLWSLVGPLLKIEECLRSWLPSGVKARLRRVADRKKW